MESLLTIIQLIVGLGIYNVWLIRPHRASAYRGKGAGSLKKEFQAYGLSVRTMRLVGAIKLISATFLILGIWNPEFIRPSALVLVLMMTGAVFMHVKVRDSFKRSVPALLMLLMSLVIVLFS